jgi:hypothetical protein
MGLRRGAPLPTDSHAPFGSRDRALDTSARHAHPTTALRSCCSRRVCPSVPPCHPRRCDARAPRHGPRCPCPRPHPGARAAGRREARREAKATRADGTRRPTRLGWRRLSDPGAPAVGDGWLAPTMSEGGPHPTLHPGPSRVVETRTPGGAPPALAGTPCLGETSSPQVWEGLIA